MLLCDSGTFHSLLILHVLVLLSYHSIWSWSIDSMFKSTHYTFRETGVQFLAPMWQVIPSSTDIPGNWTTFDQWRNSHPGGIQKFTQAHTHLYKVIFKKVWGHTNLIVPDFYLNFIPYLHLNPFSYIYKYITD